MRETFVVRSVRRNIGISQVHLTHDEFATAGAQPTEILINIQSKEFEVGDHWQVSMKLVRTKVRR